MMETNRQQKYLHTAFTVTCTTYTSTFEYLNTKMVALSEEFCRDKERNHQLHLVYQFLFLIFLRKITNANG